MKYDEYKKMKNFAVIIDQDKVNKTTEDNLETRINPKLSNFRKFKSLGRDILSKADKSSDTVGKILLAAPTTAVGLPGVGLIAGGAILGGKNKIKSMYKNYGTSGFNKSTIFEIDPEKYYIIDYVDDLHINLYGDKLGYPTRDDAKREFNEGDYLHNRQGAIRINKGITLLNNYPQKFRRVADD